MIGSSLLLRDPVRAGRGGAVPVALPAAEVAPLRGCPPARAPSATPSPGPATTWAERSREESPVGTLDRSSARAARRTGPRPRWCARSCTWLEAATRTGRDRRPARHHRACMQSWSVTSCSPNISTGQPESGSGATSARAGRPHSCRRQEDRQDPRRCGWAMVLSFYPKYGGCPQSKGRLGVTGLEGGERTRTASRLDPQRRLTVMAGTPTCRRVL